jgi:hypothetical protein
MLEVELTALSAFSARPDPAAPDLLRALARAWNGKCGGAIPEAFLPPHVRPRLEARLGHLREALVPAGDSTIRLVLSTLSRMPTRALGDPAEARFALELDVAVLRGLPEWALAEAARKFLMSDREYRPGAGTVRQEALRLTEPFERERWRIETTLSAPIEQPIAAPGKALALKARALLRQIERKANPLDPRNYDDPKEQAEIVAENERKLHELRAAALGGMNGIARETKSLAQIRQILSGRLIPSEAALAETKAGPG